MSVVFMKQDQYKSHIDEIFEIGIVDIADFSSVDTIFECYIGKEILGPDGGKQYIIHSIMRDIMTNKLYAFVRN